MFDHVLCVYPYRREVSNSGFLPPLGLEYIAVIIKPHARTMDLVDLRKYPGRMKDFLRPETDLVCFSINWDRDADFMCEEIRSVPPEIFTLVGGRHATEDPEGWLTRCPNVDALVRGDGEEAVAEFCKGVPLDRIAGLSFRRNGRLSHNPVRKTGPIQDRPFPVRSLRKTSYPVLVDGADIGVTMDLVAGSRGCPFNCKFCTFNQNPWGEKRAWSGRSPESIVDELAEIDAELVAFTDDLFTRDMDRVEKICDLILERGIRKRYIINARLEIARRPDVMKKMEAAGFTVLLVGIESAHDKTLRSMAKGFNTAKIREYFSVLRRSKMFLHGYFILGNLGESEEEIRQITPFAHELGLDSIGLSTLQARPHSGVEALVKTYPGYHISESGKVYSDALSVRDIRKLRRCIHREFYTPGQILHLVRKFARNGVLSLLPAVAPRLPRLVLSVLSRMRRQAKRRARK